MKFRNELNLIKKTIFHLLAFLSLTYRGKTSELVIIWEEYKNKQTISLFVFSLTNTIT